MFTLCRQTIMCTICLVVVFCFAYPFVVTVTGRAFFNAEINGSMVSVNGHIVGSSLLGQRFQKARYFHPRPSATDMEPYNAMASGGSNLGPTSSKLQNLFELRADFLLKENGELSILPPDLFMASASGLDPHISPAAALWQAGRVARARQLPEGEVVELVMKHIEKPTFGILGNERINVLLLNIALDMSNLQK